MTEGVQIALITGAVTVVSVILASWVQVKRIGAVNHKLNEQTRQAAIVEKKVDEVHVVVNNKSDIAANEIKDLKAQVAALTGVLTKLVVKTNGPDHGPGAGKP